MGVTIDFMDVDNFFIKGDSEVKDIITEIGKEAVDYAKSTGTYQDRTGNLRKSNSFQVDGGLVLENSMEYASCVEAKGYEVLSSAALDAEKKLKERIL